MTETNKSNLRQKLELLESAIFISWMRDQDKTTEIIEATNLIEEILSQKSLEAFFENNAEDMKYFCIKFTKETISNIMRQPMIYGVNGDDIALQFLVSYLKLLVKFCDYNYKSLSPNPLYNNLLDNLKEIFDFSKSFYREYNFMAERSGKSKKSLSYDKFNDLLPKNSTDIVVFKVGDYVDVLIDNTSNHHYFNQKSIWVRGLVEREENEYYLVFTMEKSEVKIFKGSNDIASAGRMTIDYEWRTNLKELDVIDGFDRGRWYPATILVRLYSN